MKSLAVAVIVLAAAAAPATDYYLLGTDAMSASAMNGAGSTPGWATSPGGTKSATAMTAGNTYYVDNSYGIRTPQTTAAYTAPAASLVFKKGSLLHKVGNSCVFTIADLVVDENGYCEYTLASGEKYTHIFAGGATIRTGGVLFVPPKEDARPFQIRANVSGPGTLHIGVTASCVDASVTLSGDNSGLTGPLVISNRAVGVTFSTASSLPADLDGTAADGLKLFGSLMLVEADGAIGENRGVTVAGTAASTLAVKTGSTLTIASPLSGSGTLNLGNSTHAGTVMLTASPDFSGTINVNYGTLHLGRAAYALKDRCVVGANGTLTVDDPPSHGLILYGVRSRLTE